MRLTGIDPAPRGALLRRRMEHQLMRRFVDHPAVLPAVVFIGHDLAVGIDGGAHVGEMGRAVVVPAVLVGAHELHAHRFADRLRHHGCGLGGVVVAASAIGARAFDVLHAHLVDRHAQHLRQHVAGVEDILGRADHQRPVSADVADGAVRAERCMRLVGAVIGCGRDVRGLLECLVGIAQSHDRGVVGLRRPHPGEQIGVAWQRAGLLPGHLQGA